MKSKVSAFLMCAICFLCNILDGMDVLIISYTAPVIAKAWAISPANLGVVFSSGLIGMTMGAVFIAPLSDRFGRKPIMVSAALLMAICIYLTGSSENVNELLIYRFVSGLGIGAMMANTTTMAAEYAPAATRDFWVSLVVAGYPVGAVITGLISTYVIENFGWSRLYQMAGIATLVVVPILFFFLRESSEFKQKAKPKEANLRSLFSNELKLSTIPLWLSLFLSFSTLYFLMNWIPKLASNAGLGMKSSIYAGILFNVGAVVGIPVQGYLSIRFGLKKTIAVILFITAALLLGYSFLKSLNWLILVLLGFGVQSSFVGLYAVAARLYPTPIRSTGVGWALGMGRLGGILGPIAGGFLVSAGFEMVGSFAIFAIPVITAGIITLLIRSTSIS
jgi:MFS transporter, AAHS family, 4-hydroxybenzoate transporter